MLSRLYDRDDNLQIDRETPCASPRHKRPMITTKMRISEKQRYVYACVWRRRRREGQPAGNRPMDYVVSRVYHTHTHTRTYMRESGNALWPVPPCPGLPAVVVSENFGNKLTRGRLASARPGRAAPRRWQWQRQRQDSFTSCITPTRRPSIATRRCYYSSRARRPCERDSPEMRRVTPLQRDTRSALCYNTTLFRGHTETIDCFRRIDRRRSIDSKPGIDRSCNRSERYAVNLRADVIFSYVPFL